MKKIFILGIVILFISTFSLTAFAAELDGDYCAVSQTNEVSKEKPVISDVLASEDGNSDIDDQQLEIAYNEIVELAKSDKNIIAVKIMPKSHIILLQIDGSPEQVKEYIKKFDRQYGSFFVLTDNIDAVSDVIEMDYGTTGNIIGADTKFNPFINLWFWSSAAMMLIGIFSIFFLKYRRIHVLKTANGNVIEQSTAISKREIVSAVKNNESAPSDTVFNSIMQKIDKSDR